MSEPAVKRLGEELSMEDDFSDKDFNVPSWPSPEPFPASPDVNLELLPFGGFLRSFESSLQPQADMETHAPEEENQRREEHDVENEVFVHLRPVTNPSNNSQGCFDFHLNGIRCFSC